MLWLIRVDEFNNNNNNNNSVLKKLFVIFINNSRYKDLLTLIQQQTPHSWSSNTRDCFPPPLAEFFSQNQPPKESKQQLRLAIEEEHRKVSAMNPDEWLAHFSQTTGPPIFLCLLWKMLLETRNINPIAYTVIERIGARGLNNHLRTFCDFLVYEFANSGK